MKKQLEKEIIKKTHDHEIFCDLCKKSIGKESEHFKQGGTLTAMFDYGSEYDTDDLLSIDICDDCFTNKIREYFETQIHLCLCGEIKEDEMDVCKDCR